MRAALVTAFGGPEVLKVVNDHPLPKINNPKEVLIKVAYAGLNPVDTYTREGQSIRAPALPYPPGYDGAGIVEQVGSAVTHVKKGDRVWFSGAISGATAEYTIALNESRLLKAQPSEFRISPLIVLSSSEPGKSVLVHGASGGVGTAAVQIAKANGIVAAGMTKPKVEQILGTAGTPEGLDLVHNLGAKVVANHREAGYEKELLKEFPKGFDLIAENAAHVNLSRDIELVGLNGEIAVIGNRSPIEINARGLMIKEASIFGVALFLAAPEENKEAGSAINKIFESGVKPVVDKVFDLQDIAKAHEYIHANPGAKGNLVIRIADLE